MKSLPIFRISQENLQKIASNPNLTMKAFTFLQQQQQQGKLEKNAALPVIPSSPSLQEDMALLFTNKNSCDVTIELDDSDDHHVIDVHKYILASKSHFFSRMFLGCFKESTQSKIKHQTRIPFNTFQLMIEYFYTSNFSKFNVEDALWILEEFDFYAIEDNSFKQYLQSLVASEISKETCVAIYKVFMNIFFFYFENHSLPPLTPNFPFFFFCEIEF
jgi:hypothetical protein